MPVPKPREEKVMALTMRDSSREIDSESGEKLADVLLQRMRDIVPSDTLNVFKTWLCSMGFSVESEGKAPSQYKVLSNEDCKALIDMIRSTSDAELLDMGFEPMTVGFANYVWAIEKYGQPMVLKRYTDLVFLRVEQEAVGVVDVAAGEAGIGPRVLFSSAQGLVMERLGGRTLEEKDMHKGDFSLLEEVADILAKLHRLPVPAACAGEPMLWRTVDKMLEVAGRRPELWPEKMPSIEVVRAEIAAAQKALERHAPQISLCHGDFKPSNIIKQQEGVRIIDYELAGPNYRGFDLMKVFRTAEGSSEICMIKFLEAYAMNTAKNCEKSIYPPASTAVTGSDHDPDPSCTKDIVSELLAECRYFEPLTWLEASIFFLALPQFKPQDASRWNDLAVDRWSKFEATKSLIL